MIHVGFISTLGRLREVDPAQVKSLAESIKEVGLINPITVYPREIIRNGQHVEGYGLVAGAHRLEACKSLGWQEVPALVVDLDANDRIIAECDENLCGSRLSPSEKAEFTAARKRAYEGKHGPAKGNSARGANTVMGRGDVTDNLSTTSFADDQADKTGETARNVRRNAERGEKVTPAALAMVKGTSLDTGAFLDKLKKIKPDNQCDYVQRKLDDLNRPKPKDDGKKAKIDADVKSRAAKEVAEIIAEHVPSGWWDAVKANLYAAGARNIADAFTNITGESLMDRRFK